MKKRSVKIGNFIFKNILLISTLLFIESCSQKKEFVEIASGFWEDPSIPKMAIEINLNGDCYYQVIPENDTGSYYYSKISLNEAKVISDFVKSRIGSTDSLSIFQDSDAVVAEFFIYNEEIVQHGFKYFVTGTDGDSIKNFIKLIKTSRDFKPIPFHKFYTTMQNETLPVPPPAPIPDK